LDHPLYLINYGIIGDWATLPLAYEGAARQTSSELLLRKVITFSEMRCEIRDSTSKLVASGHKKGSLYCLDHVGRVHQKCTSSDGNISNLASPIWPLGNTRHALAGKEQIFSGLNFL
jgi:hypothetical protein